MRIAIATDAWQPQVNGVVTTLSRTTATLRAKGHDVLVLSPDAHRTLPCPTYPEIRLALLPRRAIERALRAFVPDALHVATEGPIGMAGRRYCTSAGLAFTTSYHTQFPQYVRQRVPIPESWSYAYLRRHHGAAQRTLVATEHVRRELVAHGFRNVVLWSRGVDTEVFRPCGRAHLALPRPIWVYAGRVAVEKNLHAFLGLALPGTKVVVGDGPDRTALMQRYPETVFTGYKFGAELAAHLSAADVFVFPSRTDTFGLVMLEAIACGTPVAAFPVTGPLDVINRGVNGELGDDLAHAALAALRLDRAACRASALARTWERATEQFLSHLVYAADGRNLIAPASLSTGAPSRS
jgi:glycosyltransferase involved in cell wall biosynthesis